jgi:hypothetical protein
MNHADEIVGVNHFEVEHDDAGHIPLRALESDVSQAVT